MLHIATDHHNNKKTITAKTYTRKVMVSPVADEDDPFWTVQLASDFDDDGTVRIKPFAWEASPPSTGYLDLCHEVGAGVSRV